VFGDGAVVRPACRGTASGCWVSDAVRVLPVVDELEQDVGECFGDWRGWLAEADEDLVAFLEDVVDGEADNAAGGLGVEQHQTGGRPGTCGWGVVGQDAPEQGQAAGLGKAFASAGVQRG